MQTKHFLLSTFYLSVSKLFISISFLSDLRILYLSVLLVLF